jgi:hypothetical protein
MPESPDSPCPIDCPNRRTNRDTASGKVAAYVFALICSGFLAYQAKAYESKDKELPLIIWMPCMVAIGTALGVNVQPESIGKVITPLLKP